MAAPIDIGGLRIVHYPAPVLRRVCKPVETFDEQLERLIARMFELMRSGNGVGLAAPQVGVELRLFVCNHTGEPGDDRAVINPEFGDPEGVAVMEEGCLSLPNVTIAVRRPEKITLRGRDGSGEPFEVRAGELQARVWQHETDHLDGRMITDYMSEAAKIANRRALKQLHDEYKGGKKRKTA